MQRPDLRLAAKIGVAAGLLILLALAGIKAMSNTPTDPPADRQQPAAAMSSEPPGSEEATFGGGCFWCTEAMFARLKGVHSVTSGYSGGHVKQPTYQQVCTGTTGHAEVVQLSYDPQQISYAELLEVFWATHDPTTRNRQGNDVGPQYRSVVFYHNDRQRKLAEDYRQELDAARVFPAAIVTEISPFGEFFPAENYHQQYYELNGRQPYCRAIIRPKVEKLEKAFADRLQSSSGAKR